MTSDPETFLCAVDLLLHHTTRFEIENAAQLEQTLEEAGSAWRVVAHEDNFKLERRVLAPVAAAAGQVMGSAGRAGQLLALAWTAAFGRDPDPSAAYREAVRAVEAAAQPVITPKDATATLGKMISSFRDAPDKWEFAIDPSETSAGGVILGMMQVLWQGQYDRHGTGSPDQPIHVEQQEAEAAVQLSVTLVQWFVSRAIKAR